MAVITAERIVLFEFKTVRGRRGSGTALQQLKDRGCERKHVASGKPVHWVKCAGARYALWKPNAREFRASWRIRSA